VLFVAGHRRIGFEQQGNPCCCRTRRRSRAGQRLAAGGNMEGKETRFGIANPACSRPSPRPPPAARSIAMHDSFTPLGGMVPLVLMQLGEVVFGGVGSGLYGMLMFAILAVFIAGLMIGRTPEYLGKKIEATR
jgi:K+-transporting ATPase ATPase A chain